MALGKTHDLFNLLVCAIFVGLFIGIGIDIALTFSFILGWLLATFIFSPDTDIMPKKRTRILQFFLYPYSILFKHRGISHMLFVGTVTRVLYLILVIGALIFIFDKMKYSNYSLMNYFQSIVDFIGQFDYKMRSHRIVIWFFSGMILADASHIFLDKISSYKNKMHNIFIK